MNFREVVDFLSHEDMTDQADDTMDGILGQVFLTWLWFRSDVAESA